MLLLRSPEKQVSEVICKLQGNHQQKQSYLCLQPSAHCFTVVDFPVHTTAEIKKPSPASLVLLAPKMQRSGPQVEDAAVAG